MQKPSLFNVDEKRIAYVSTYPPRECGIANFTKDLIDAIDQLHEFRPSVIIAINEKGATYNYNRRVKFQIERDSIHNYVQAARYANLSKVNLVNLQHEFGLLGGEWGEYINSFLENLQKPVVTTLHTILPNFGSAGRTVLESIAYHSASIVIITRTARQLLKNYNIKREKINIIPHGCPDVPFVTSEKPKTSLGLKGRIVLSTFGLINRGKGIQYAIRALSSLVKKEPRILYLIIGETHPEVRRIEGERYRKRLMRLVDELKLGKHVRFHNRFLSKRELIRYLQATDIYITPYVDRNQISSGTLVYALGTGKAIISTPYLHAEETLADGRGLICKFRNPTSIAECINRLLGDPELRLSLERKAYAYSRNFTWPKVAEKYAKLFNRLLKD
ncbi:MAG: glycosyltransferase family 4 protein [Candidatus Bathyarchaeota archaeon]|nr:glycosyltransferase family 4 protein [Candidatus Bathyarchaeota archaeon]